MELYNFTKLKIQVISYWTLKNLFQFHYGTIESANWNCQMKNFAEISIPLWYDWENQVIFSLSIYLSISIPLWYDWELTSASFDALAATNFNSTMVRLRDGLFYKLQQSWQISIPLWYDWEVFCKHLLSLLYMYFNSTMVRLRVVCEVHVLWAFLISIPLWYDWEYLPGEMMNIQFQISIPLWYDWEFAELNCYAEKLEISIPLWYDWESGLVRAKRRPAWYFNSTMVRLRDTIPSTLHQLPRQFQFHYGTIESCSSVSISIMYFYFNSTMVRLRAVICSISNLSI